MDEDGHRRPARRALSLAAVAIAALLPGAAAHADDPDVLRARAGQLADASQRLDDAADRALLELFALESGLARAERRTTTLRSRLAVLADQGVTARRRLALARRDHEVAQTRLGARLRAIYVDGEADPLAVLLGAGSLSDALDALDGLQAIARTDERIVAQLRTAGRQLAALSRDLARQERRVGSLEHEAAAALADLTAARDEKATYLDALAREQALNQRELALLEERARSLEARAAELNGAATAPGSRPVAVPAPVPAELPPPAPAPPPPPPPAPAPEGAPPGGRTLVVESTAYAMHGTTATGVPTGRGIVATDPAVIPLGTRLWIPGYGEGIAADTGGAITGAKIDVWLPTEAEALQWGRRTITIAVYDT